MNKAQLVEKLATRLKLTKSQSEEMLDATVDVIQGAVSRGDEVKLVGFGTFSRAKRKARKGRNPQTGQEFAVPAGWAPKFRPGKDFRTSVSKK